MAYLPRDGLGYLFHELHYARVLVGRGDALHMVLYLLHELVAGVLDILLGKYNGGFDHLTAHRVGAGVLVHNIVCEVKVLRHTYMQVLAEVVVVGELRLCQEFSIIVQTFRNLIPNSRLELINR